MPTKKGKQQGFTDDQLTYLGAVFDISRGFGGQGKNSAIQIWGKHKQPWAESYVREMAELYGGKHGAETFGSRDFWHWTLPLEERLRLFNILDEAGKIKSMDPYQRTNYQKLLERGIADL